MTMMEQIAAGTRWVRRHDATVWVLDRVHADRLAELHQDEVPFRWRLFLSVDDLPRKFEPLT